MPTTGTAAPDLLTLTFRGRPVPLLAEQDAELAELEAIQNDVFPDGVWFGKTAALHSASGTPGAPDPGTTRYGAAQHTAYRAGDDLFRRGPDGLPLAWSCWDAALTLVHRIRETGRFKAWLLDANGTEDGARFEPHAVVGIQSRSTLNGYLADPYFEVLPVPVMVGHTAARSGVTSAATLVGGTERQLGVFSVRHISYAVKYTYEVSARLTCDRESILLDTAPGWAVARNQRVARTRCGDLTIRAADLTPAMADATGLGPLASQVKVWDHADGVGAGDVRQRTYPTWDDAMRAADELVTARIATLAELDTAWQL